MKYEYSIDDLKKRNPELTDELLEKLKNWAVEHNVPRLSQEQLAAFAHSNYFNPERTITSLEHFCEMRKTCPEFFGNMNIEDPVVKRSYDILCCAESPVLTPEGYKVFYYRLIDIRPEMYNFNNCQKLFIMMMDADLCVEGCRPGVILVLDMHGFRFAHIFKIPYGQVIKLLRYIQEALPLRVKAVVVVNTTWFVDRLLAWFKPLLKEELFNLIHIYSEDYTKVHPIIPPMCLPKEYGGELPSIFELREYLRQKLITWKEQLLDQESFYNNYTNPKKS